MFSSVIGCRTNELRMWLCNIWQGTSNSHPNAYSHIACVKTAQSHSHVAHHLLSFKAGGGNWKFSPYLWLPSWPSAFVRQWNRNIFSSKNLVQRHINYQFNCQNCLSDYSLFCWQEQCTCSLLLLAGGYCLGIPSHWASAATIFLQLGLQMVPYT